MPGPLKTIAQEPAADTRRYVLRLYVAGPSMRSLNAITNAKEICEDRLKGRYQLEIIDIYENPAAISGADIVAVPTLVKQLPLPLRQIIGDLAERDRVLVGLGLQPSPID